MIDWEDIIRTEDVDELKEVKLWLFQENIRLQNERRELDSSRERLMNERIQLRKELDEQFRRTAQERKRLKEESLFFEKKLAILEDGFRQLDEDRRAFEKRRKKLEEQSGRRHERLDTSLVEETARLLFRGTSNPLALRKRYKDLVKIFHPDNMFGDEELAQSINREYLRLKGGEADK